ncbi:MAG: translation elongation factor Ts [Gammaproteobacteria bacterium]|nr:translation elongation factor Ts [Gammaproteobacteria bacterium]
MAITASQVKELRERTGAGMMECKKALVECDGDIDSAIEHMRKTGLAKADKKAGRIAAEGGVIIKASPDSKTIAILEVNSETDFVSGGEDFAAFTNEVCQIILAQAPADVDVLMASKMANGDTVDIACRALIAKIGEKISVRRFALLNTDGAFSFYSHGARIGVVVEMKGGTDELGRDVAMHIAATNPVCVSEEQVPAEILEKEKVIFIAQAKESGKPDNIIEKMIEGRINKYLKEVTLVGQPFVKDPDTTVEKLLKSNDATVLSFCRYEVGEGIEKAVDNFAEEVMAQVRA